MMSTIKPLYCIVHYLSNLTSIFTITYIYLLYSFLYQLTAVSYVYCSLDLVTSEDPHPYASLF